ncbi:hypothetical protein PLICRDRAFT_50593 [Plicaturopsis crispa FD-325 SS-3]|nr:hypothetical protein PLICRDRAFT_50593 [Plicaturopsis crispa FD-325 SS-3]
MARSLYVRAHTVDETGARRNAEAAASPSESRNGRKSKPRTHAADSIEETLLDSDQRRQNPTSKSKQIASNPNTLNQRS